MFVCSRFVRSSVEEEEEEECEETQSTKQHTVNGNATNGLLEEGSPSECTDIYRHVYITHSPLLLCVSHEFCCLRSLFAS